MLKTLIILDVDGVLNPIRATGANGTHLTLTPERIELLKTLCEYGDIVWGSSWDPDSLYQLGAIAGLGGIPSAYRSDTSDPDADTPKLAPIRRWVEMRRALGEFEWDAIVWIDDSLRDDAKEWLANLDIMALPIIPEPAVGLTAEYVNEVRAFIDRQ